MATTNFLMFYDYSNYVPVLNNNKELTFVNRYIWNYKIIFYYLPFFLYYICITFTIWTQGTRLAINNTILYRMYTFMFFSYTFF